MCSFDGIIIENWVVYNTETYEVLKGKKREDFDIGNQIEVDVEKNQLTEVKVAKRLQRLNVTIG